MPTIELTEQELQKIYELQKDLFTTSTENNPYLKNSTINPDLNKGLNTDSKTIVGAINDILAITTAVRDTNVDFIDRFNRIIGNEELNPELVKKLSLIGSNFYEALFKSWERANSSYERTILLENEIKNLRAKIEDLVIGEGGTTVLSSSIREDRFFSGKVFNLTYKPTSIEAIDLYINGIHYDTSCFSYDEENNVVTWTATDFDIINYKKATEFDSTKVYYIKEENYNYIQYEGTLDENTFNNGKFYIPDENNLDKIIIKYETLDVI